MPLRECRDCRYCGPDRPEGMILCNHQSWVHWDEEMRVFAPDFAPECQSFDAKISRHNKEYDVVEFRNGYGPGVPCCVVEYLGYDWAAGNPAWGAVPGKLYKVIRLGRVISQHNAESIRANNTGKWPRICR